MHRAIDARRLVFVFEPIGMWVCHAEQRARPVVHRIELLPPGQFVAHEPLALDARPPRCVIGIQRAAREHEAMPSHIKRLDHHRRVLELGFARYRVDLRIDDRAHACV